MKWWLAPLVCMAPAVLAQNPPPSCRPPVGVQNLASLADLPTPVRNVIRDKLKDIVDANQPFDSTDVVRHGAHFNRFAFAWKSTDRIVVVTEHGGIAYYRQVLIVPLGPRDPTPEDVPVRRARLRDICSIAEEALQQPLSSKP